LRPSALCFQIQEMLCLSLFCVHNIIKLICRCFRRAMSALTDTFPGIPQCHLYLTSILCVPCQLKVSQYPRYYVLNACQLKVALSFVFFCILMSPLRGSLTSTAMLSPIRDTFLRFSVFWCHLYCHLYLTHFPYVSFTWHFFSFSVPFRCHLYMASFFVLYLAFMSPLRDTLSVLYGFSAHALLFPFPFFCSYAGMHGVLCSWSAPKFFMLVCPFLDEKKKKKAKAPLRYGTVGLQLCAWKWKERKKESR
jgi:hypothetical protein